MENDTELADARGLVGLSGTKAFKLSSIGLDRIRQYMFCFRLAYKHGDLALHKPPPPFPYQLYSLPCTAFDASLSFLGSLIICTSSLCTPPDGVSQHVAHRESRKLIRSWSWH